MHKSKVLVQVGNVYFARRWFIDRFGRESGGNLALSDSRLLAVEYECIESIKRDALRMGIDLADIKIVKAS